MASFRSFITALDVSRSLFMVWFVVFLIPPTIAAGGMGILLLVFAQDIPSPQEVENINPSLSTRVLDARGEPFGEFFVERRQWIPLDSMPRHLIDAVTSIEDRRFWNHWGINLRRTAEAVVQTLRGNKQGGSTITQQLAKNVFLTPERTWQRKVREALVAVHIERIYTKEQILAFYLNLVAQGSSAHGVQAAANFYFAKRASQLSLEESAVLAGLIQRPNAYRPDFHPELARRRRNMVLRAMREEGRISSARYEEAVATPVTTQPWTPPNTVGGYYLEAIRQHIERTYGEEGLYHRGLIVRSTVFPALQSAADSAVARACRRLQRSVDRRAVARLGLARRYNLTDSAAADSVEVLLARMARETGTDSARLAERAQWFTVQAAAIVIDNRNGAIRALVGGRDFSLTKFNRALQARRQAGSTFKSFVYASAVEQGALTGDLILDDTLTLDDGTGVLWSPGNYDLKYEGLIPLRRALMLSKNLPTIQLAMQYGVPSTVRLARRLGIESPLPAVYSLALGAADVTLLEMTAAYSAFATLGVLRTPRLFDSIMTREGTTVERRLAIERQVMRPDHAFIMTDLLRDVVLHGTGFGITASGFAHPSAGKTGTTDDYTDAWFIGYTRHYTTGVWVGMDQKVKLGRAVTGGTVALPIWLEIMRAAHVGRPVENWIKPAGVVGYSACIKRNPDGTCQRYQAHLGVRGSAGLERAFRDSVQRAQWSQRLPATATDTTNVPGTALPPGGDRPLVF